MTCTDCSACFSDEERAKLTGKGWSAEEIAYAEHSVIEDKIKELL